MRYIKSFNEANKSIKGGFPTDPKKIRKICDKYGIEPSRIHPDGTVDFLGDVYFNEQEEYFNMKKLPLKFGTVEGEFHIHGSNLRSLEGCPEYCESFLVGCLEKITSMVGGPKYVTGDYILQDCGSIKSLEGMPHFVGGDVDVSDTKITNLVGSPREVGGEFNAWDCPLESLEGSPEIIGAGLYLKGTRLSSLEGCPKFVGGEFDITTERKTLWDPTGLRDLDCSWVMCPDEPLRELMNLFNSGSEYTWGARDEVKERFERFKCSLDYNYIRGDVNHPCLDLFKIKEALDEFEIDYKHLRGLRSYTLLDEGGRPVNYLGEPTGIYKTR